MILRILAMILLVCGVICIYDARRITRKFFAGLGDENEGALGLKIFGISFMIVGGLIMYFITL